MLKDIGVDWRDRNLIAKLYLGQKGVIRVNNELSGCCEIGQRVRQGCPLSLVLFNISIQHVINEGLADVQEGVKVGGVNVSLPVGAEYNSNSRSICLLLLVVL